MAINSLEAKVASLRERAVAAQQSYALSRERVQADPTLTVEGKRIALADFAETTNATLRELSEQELAAVSAEIEQKERTVFGTPPTDSSGIIAFRDAQERASRLTSQDEGRDLLKQARLSSDRELASAVLSKALGMGWSEVVGSYREMYPADAANLDDLSALHRFANGAQDKFVRGMTYGSVSTY